MSDKVTKARKPRFRQRPLSPDEKENLALFQAAKLLTPHLLDFQRGGWVKRPEIRKPSGMAGKFPSRCLSCNMVKGRMKLTVPLLDSQNRCVAVVQVTYFREPLTEFTRGERPVLLA